MDNNTQIELRVLIQRLLGMPENSVRPADTSQPTTGGNYAIVQQTDMVGQGWAGGYKHARQSSIVTLTIDFMGDNAAHYANQLKIAMQTPYALDMLFDLDVGYLSCSDPRNLTALELERTKRFQVRLQLSYLTSYAMPDTVPDDYRDRYENEPQIDTKDLPVGLIIEP